MGYIPKPPQIYSAQGVGQLEQQQQNSSTQNLYQLHQQMQQIYQDQIYQLEAFYRKQIDTLNNEKSQYIVWCEQCKKQNTDLTAKNQELTNTIENLKTQVAERDALIFQFQQQQNAFGIDKFEPTQLSYNQQDNATFLRNLDLPQQLHLQQNIIQLTQLVQTDTHQQMLFEYPKYINTDNTVTREQFLKIRRDKRVENIKKQKTYFDSMKTENKQVVQMVFEEVFVRSSKLILVDVQNNQHFKRVVATPISTYKAIYTYNSYEKRININVDKKTHYSLENDNVVVYTITKEELNNFKDNQLFILLPNRVMYRVIENNLIRDKRVDFITENGIKGCVKLIDKKEEKFERKEAKCPLTANSKDAEIGGHDDFDPNEQFTEQTSTDETDEGWHTVHSKSKFNERKEKQHVNTTPHNQSVVDHDYMSKNKINKSNTQTQSNAIHPHQIQKYVNVPVSIVALNIKDFFVHFNDKENGENYFDPHDLYPNGQDAGEVKYFPNNECDLIFLNDHKYMMVVDTNWVNQQDVQVNMFGNTFNIKTQSKRFDKCDTQSIKINNINCYIYITYVYGVYSFGEQGKKLSKWSKDKKKFCENNVLIQKENNDTGVYYYRLTGMTMDRLFKNCVSYLSQCEPVFPIVVKDVGKFDVAFDIGDNRMLLLHVTIN
ncbi:hypothetical protein EIN_173100 [Entamoeba invadens IP1]|uniref:Uncharacterized protein n=1 Tax=Entamoeba invadens IP1 TaxID=370355 RepID=A0A0A1TYK9_ENTIV|nr:hypothetical protein EIN_173100 [Entamoeba invadens IP1]ELP84645.1 hypothetical protein EIN_173100 [Entamoeba invadens IP1]|eukprot:XP_004183991.1 hypothetical protein EIN_173100 [Entamoeba invadens IP1]